MQVLATPLSIRSFACTAYLFVFFALLASLASSAALIHLLACSLAHFAHSQACGKVYDLMCQYHLVLNHSGLTRISQFHPFMLNFTTQLSLCVSVSLPLSPSLSVCLSLFLYLSVLLHLSVHLFLSISVSLSVCLCVCVCLSVCLSHFKRVFLSTHWTDFYQTWRMTGYTMRMYESLISRWLLTCIIL